MGSDRDRVNNFMMKVLKPNISIKKKVPKDKLIEKLILKLLSKTDDN